MKRLFLICLSMFLLTGCTINNDNTQLFVGDDIQYINDKGVANNLVCIDNIEYIYFNRGYKAGLTPHLKADKFDNPKVIRCGR